MGETRAAVDIKNKLSVLGTSIHSSSTMLLAEQHTATAAKERRKRNSSLSRHHFFLPWPAIIFMASVTGIQIDA